MHRSPRTLIPLIILGALILTIAAVVANFTGLMGYPPALHAEPALASIAPEISETPILESLPIRPGDTLRDVIGQADLDEEIELGLVNAVDGAYDVRKLRAGTSFVLTRTALREPRRLEYQTDTEHILVIDFPESPDAGESLAVRTEEIASTVATTPICAELRGSLFESISSAGENPELAIRIAEIFAWDLDFYTDPQNGDDFCVLVEKKSYENGQPATYGRILAATYNNVGKLHDAYLFEDKDGKAAYFSGDGKSTQAAFLRSPLKFAARISSRFTHSRYHPVLKIRRPHLGVDYAAPTGTPVQSVAAGTVTFSGRSGGAGNLVKVRHSNNYETYYMHLSRRSVKVGQKIDQGQLIGLVGSTGLATGPHLDFRIRKNGRYLNFESLNLPRESTVEAARMGLFKQKRDELIALIETHPRKQGEVLAKNDKKPASEAEATETQ